MSQVIFKVLNIGYRDDGIVSDGSFSYQISDIGRDIGDMRAYRTFISDTIYW